MSEKLAPSISDAHFEKMMALKPANARKHLCAGSCLWRPSTGSTPSTAIADNPAHSP